MGESVAQVAEVDGERVAVLLWAAAAFKGAARDAWIGWRPALQWQRMHLAANSRFLILPGRVLSPRIRDYAPAAAPGRAAAGAVFSDGGPEIGEAAGGPDFGDGRGGSEGGRLGVWAHG